MTFLENEAYGGHTESVRLSIVGDIGGIIDQLRLLLGERLMVWKSYRETTLEPEA